MKRPFILWIFLFVLVLACNIPAPETVVPATGQPPAATQTPQNPETPTVTPTAPVAPNVQCNELSFYLDPAVAATYSCATVPENTENDPYQTPQYTEVVLEGYAIPGAVYFRRIRVYRLADFLALQPRLAPRADELKALIAGGVPGADALPLLDMFGAQENIHSQYKVVPFSNGSGIRFVTLYSQYCPPINNEDLFLAFQGLTGDEQYFVSAILRTSNPILQAGPEPFPGGVDQGTFCDQYAGYIAGIRPQLDAQSEASFLPSLTLLDALISSIVIQP